MNRAETIEHLKSPDALGALLVDADATGNWSTFKTVRLNAAGELEIVHPTNPVGWIPAPESDNYRKGFWSDED